MRREVIMIWPNLQALVMEARLTTETYWPQIEILQGLQDTRGLNNHPRWPNPELDSFVSDLDSQLHAQSCMSVVVTLQPHAQAYLSVIVA